MQKYELAQLMNNFALELYGELRKENNNGSNMLFSPTSVYASLAMLYHGAKGNTADEIIKVMKIKDYEDFHKTFSKTWEGILKAQKSDVSSLTLSNRLWMQDGFTVKEEFSQILEENYKSDVGIVNFSSDKKASVETMNKWIAELTHDKMVDVLKDDAIPVDTKLLIINVLYFDGKWENSFCASETEKMPFYTSGGNSVEVDMMHQKGCFSYVYDDEFGCETLVARYKKTSIRLLIILPKERDGLEALEKRILTKEEDDDILFNWMMPRRQDIILYLPKMTFSQQSDLVKPLNAMGIRELFTASSNLGGITEEPMAVAKLAQQAFIQVDEEGTCAAAVTESCIVAAGPGPTTFKVDHPFMFMLVDNDTKLIMFWARYCKP